MKKKVLLAVIIAVLPALASAQSRLSISPAAGFYKAELDALADDLSLLESLGAKVEKPNGNFHFGGKLYYEKSPQWSWLAEVSTWKDKAEGNISDGLAALAFQDEVRLVPIMIGSQYYFSRPQTNARFYGGATGGVILVNVKSQISLTAPGAAPVSETSNMSGSDFVGKPFVGLEIANTSKMSFWGELGYMFGKYSLETTEPGTGAKTERNVSVNGLHITGGVKFRF